jgi:hypothetical protein
MPKQVIEDIHHVMDFGMWKGRTVGDVFEKAPSYLKWAHENTEHFCLSESMYKQVLEELKK